MNRMIVHTLLAGAALVACSATMAQAHWSYEGEAGPANWGKLDPSYVMCGIGRNQSPIDLSRFVEAELAPLKMQYKTSASVIVNNGHTLQVNHAPGSTLMVDGREFELKQFHFHSPSENPLLAKLWQHVPPHKGDKSALPAGMNVKALLPTLHSHYAFNGSLTTPPCTEGVRCS